MNLESFILFFMKNTEIEEYTLPSIPFQPLDIINYDCYIDLNNCSCNLINTESFWEL